MTAATVVAGVAATAADVVEAVAVVAGADVAVVVDAVRKRLFTAENAENYKRKEVANDANQHKNDANKK